MSSKNGLSATKVIEGISASPADNTPVFSVGTGQKIPPKEQVRSPEHSQARLESLMRVPSHRPAATKYDYDPINRTIVPFTKEDEN